MLCWRSTESRLCRCAFSDRIDIPLKSYIPSLISTLCPSQKMVNQQKHWFVSSDYGYTILTPADLWHSKVAVIWFASVGKIQRGISAIATADGLIRGSQIISVFTGRNVRGIVTSDQHPMRSYRSGHWLISIQELLLEKHITSMSEDFSSGASGMLISASKEMLIMLFITVCSVNESFHGRRISPTCQESLALVYLTYLFQLRGKC